MREKWKNQAEELLKGLYSEGESEEIITLMDHLSGNGEEPPSDRPLTSGDVWLITYGDSIHETSRPGLKTLAEVAVKSFTPLFSLIHILPFFPFSSDDGFAVTDYTSVRSDLGGWEDVKRIGDSFSLMADLVLNHISSRSEWVRRYLDGDPAYKDFFIEADPAEDLSLVVRPRSLPLLTPFEKRDGSTVWLWTTFSPDQADLNYANPAVLKRMLEVAAFYLKRGISALRLDAVGFLWKKKGTSCLHLEETHRIVKLFRLFCDLVPGNTLLVTETNVPHKENISYFGEGDDEAHVVYNFSLPPLILYTFLSGDVTKLRYWLSTLRAPSPRCTFLNFTASHDGIGVRPLEGLVDEEELQEMIRRIQNAGGIVSMRDDPRRGERPYELNITYFDAVTAGLSRDSLKAAAFLASQAIMLFLPGIPAVYINSLFGMENWTEGVKSTGRARTINRYKIPREEAERMINGDEGLRSEIWNRYRRLLRFRREEEAFAPGAPARYPHAGNGLFAVVRGKGEARLFCLVNVTDKRLEADVSPFLPDSFGFDRLNGRERLAGRKVVLLPYEVCVFGSSRRDISVDSGRGHR